MLSILTMVLATVVCQQTQVSDDAVRQAMHRWQQPQWREVTQKQWTTMSTLSDKLRARLIEQSTEHQVDAEGNERWVLKSYVIATNSLDKTRVQQLSPIASGPAVPPATTLMFVGDEFRGTGSNDAAGQWYPTGSFTKTFEQRKALVESGAVIPLHGFASRFPFLLPAVCSQEFLSDPAASVTFEGDLTKCEVPSVKLTFWLDKKLVLRKASLFAGPGEQQEVWAITDESTNGFPRWWRSRSVPPPVDDEGRVLAGSLEEINKIHLIAALDDSAFQWTTYQETAADLVNKRSVKRVSVDKPGEFTVVATEAQLRASQVNATSESVSVNSDGKLQYQRQSSLSWVISVGVALVAGGALLWWRRRH